MMCINCTIYLFILFIVRGILCVNLRIQPSGQVVVLAGHNVTVLCQAGVPITRCRIKLPTQASALTLSPSSLGQGEFNYYGSGLQYGDCGVTLLAVTDKLNGAIVCSVNTKFEKEESTATMTIIVARSPTTVDLRVSRDAKEGDVFTASCVVRGARPAATITWFLDGAVINDGVSEAITSEDTATQNLTRTLSWRDNNRTLGCAATHVSLKGSEMNSWRRITVLYAPKDFQRAMEPSDFITGKPGTVSVTFSANPRPSYKWLFGNIVVESGTKDASGKYEADVPVSIGDDRWWAVLRISEVMPTDFGLFLLEARNSIGEEKYSITITDNETPRGLSSSTSLAVVIGVVATICFTLVVIAVVAVVRARLHTSEREISITPSHSGLGVNHLDSIDDGTHFYNSLLSE